MPRRSLTPDFSTPTRRELVHAYGERLTSPEMEQAAHIADAIEITPAPLAQHLVLIPVAAHQEQQQIAPALEQYARQQTKQPFSVVLGLNSPTAQSDNHEIDATIMQIELAKRRYPELDIRTSLTFYDNPTIGTIRRDLWNGALLAAMDQGAYTQEDIELIAINHDIDTLSMTPHYMRRVQEHYDRSQRAHDNAGMQSTPHTPRSTLIKHAPTLAYPVISKGVYWDDFYHREMNNAYEAGMVFPLSYYAYKDGFDPDAKTHEVGSIFPREVRQHKIPGTNMETSPRRYIDRLQYGYSKLWTEDSFGPDDQCRQPTIPATDLQLGELETIITKDASIRQTVAGFAAQAIYNRLSRLPEFSEPESTHNQINADFIERKIHPIILQKIHLTTAVLERVVQSPRLSKEAASIEDDPEFVLEVLDRVIARTD